MCNKTILLFSFPFFLLFFIVSVIFFASLSKYEIQLSVIILNSILPFFTLNILFIFFVLSILFCKHYLTLITYGATTIACHSFSLKSIPTLKLLNTWKFSVLKLYWNQKHNAKSSTKLTYNTPTIKQEIPKADPQHARIENTIWNTFLPWFWGSL